MVVRSRPGGSEAVERQTTRVVLARSVLRSGASLPRTSESLHIAWGTSCRNTPARLTVPVAIRCALRPFDTSSAKSDGLYGPGSSRRQKSAQEGCPRRLMDRGSPAMSGCCFGGGACLHWRSAVIGKPADGAPACFSLLLFYIKRVVMIRTVDNCTTSKLRGRPWA